MARFDPIIRRAFAAAVIVWAALIILAPALTRGGLAPALTRRAGDVIALGVYLAGSLVCHQRPERSFHLFGVQMPVCARCTGIYLGAALAAIVTVILVRTPALVTPKRRSREGGWPRWAAAAVSAAPAVLTLVYEWTSGDMPSNGIRAASGVPMGAVASWMILWKVE